MVKPMWIVLFSVLAFLDAKGALAERTLYSTIVQSSLDQQSITSSLGAVNRVSVSFKNIGTVTQNITVNLRDVHADSTLSFATQAIGAAEFPSWTQYPLSPSSRFKEKNMPDGTINLSLAPLAAGTASWALFCNFVDEYKCITSSAGDATDWVSNNDIRGAGLNSRFSVQVTVKEDRGAILSDLTTQMSVFTNLSLTGPSQSRSLNGGRPF